MSDKRHLLTNLFSLSIVRGLEYLIPLITLPYLVRVLGLENFGLVNFSLALALYFSAIMHYGFSLTAVRKIASCRGRPDEISIIYSQTITATIILIFLCACIYLPLVFFIADFRKYLELHLFSFFFVSARALFPLWFFQGVENMKQGAIVSMVARLCALLAIFSFVKSQEDFILVPALNGLAMLLCSFSSMFWIYKRYKISFKFSRFKDSIFLLREGRHAFFSQLAPDLYINSSTFLLGVYSTPVVVGAFSAASKVIDVFNSMGTIISNTFYPYLVRKPEFIGLFHKFMLAFGIAASLLCAVFSDYITAILFSKENIVVSQYIKIMTLGIFAYFVMRVYYDNGLMLIGKDNIAGKVAIFVSAIFFVLGFLFIPEWGIYGAISMLTGARCAMAMGWFITYIKTKN